jgi:outer membrane protein assembly factor BamB
MASASSVIPKWTFVLSLCTSLIALDSVPVRAAESPAAPAQVLPGKGLAQHDFLYAGESKNRRAFIVRKGKVVWMYDDPAGRGEISDAVLLSNGNLLIAHQFAVKLISPEKKVLWNLDAPKGTEIHTAMPIGTEHVLYVQNGDPALVRVVNLKTGETKKEFPVPVGNPKSVHGHFRHARITPWGTLLVAHMDAKKVCEYDASGKEVWTFATDGPWGATPLKNGNVLIVDRRAIREVTHKGETVATFTPADSPDFKLSSLQLAWRLPNGNTLVNNWFNEWSGKLDRSNPPVQAVEFTPDKKIAWVLRSWENPDLGPATTIQMLDEADVPEKVTFGDFK